MRAASARCQALCWGVLCLALSAPAHALSGVVTHVSDGDTLWVRPTEGGWAVKVRMQGLDAPELCQAWGPQARAALMGHVLRKQVEVHTLGQDGYERMLGHVALDGQDVGAWMVRSGHAWSDPFRKSRGRYATQEREARKARRGLFAEALPVEPRAFRKAHGACK